MDEYVIKAIIHIYIRYPYLEKTLINIGFIYQYVMRTDGCLDNCSVNSRRRFLSFICASASLSVAGCVGGGDETGTEPGNNIDDEERHGGHLRLASSAGGDTLNPLQYTGGYRRGLWTYSSLTRLDEELTPQPDLATDWSANEDATVWTFQLRDDVTFNYSGETVTADDVKATFDEIYAEGSTNPGQGEIGPIESVEATGEFEVEFTLEDSFSELPTTVSSQWAMILPREVLESEDLRGRLDTESFGSGPFVLEDFNPDTGTEYTASDDFYQTSEDGDQLPYVDKLTNRIIPEDNSQVTALQNQEIDILPSVPPTLVDRVEGMDGVVLDEVTSGDSYPIVMDATQPPFNDQRVLQAMKYATDRVELLEGASQGFGALGQDTVVAPVHQNYVELDDMWGDTAQVDEARALLDDAGYSDGIELDFPLYAPADVAPQVSPTAVLFQEQMAAIGIEFDIREVTWDNFLADIETREPFYVSNYAMRPASIQVLNLLHREGGTFDGMFWHEAFPESHERLVADLDAAQAEPDLDTRLNIYEDIQQNIHENAPMIVPFFAGQIRAWHDYVHNFINNPSGYRLNTDEVLLDNEAPTK